MSAESESHTGQATATYRLFGSIYNDSRMKFDDGEAVVTTPIIGVDDFGEYMVVETQTALYYVFRTDYHPERSLYAE